MCFNDAKILIEAISSFNEKLFEFYLSVKSNQKVIKVHRGCDIRKNNDISLIELYVEAEVSDRLAYCWWFDIHFQQASWKIDGVILMTKNGEQDIVVRLGDSTGTETTVFISELEKMSQILDETGVKFNLNCNI